MRSNDRRNRNRAQLRLDVLEARALMTASLQRGGVLDIRGTQRDDAIEVRLAAGDPARMQVVENGRVTFTGGVQQIVSIRIQGRAGADRLIIDESNGPITIPARIDGGTGPDTMKGGASADEIIGDTSGRDVVLASGGADTNRNVNRPEKLVRLGSANAFRDFMNRMTRARTRFGSGMERLRLDTGGPVAQPTAGTGQKSVAPGYSNTNTQVAGIDEGDIIENDGRHLYILSRNELLIVDAGDAAAPAVVSRTEVEGSPLAMYLHEGRLTVIASRWKDVIARPGDRVIPMLAMRGSGEVVVTVYDTAAAASPRVVSSTTMDGWYVDSRMVDGKLALVLQNDLLAGYWGGPMTVYSRMAAPSVKPVSDAAMARMLRKTPVESLLPGYVSKVTAADGVTRSVKGLITQPQDMLVPLGETEANLLSVVLYRTGGENPGVIGSTSVAGQYASSIFMNSSDLYLFGPRWDAGTTTTRVQRFDITGDKPALVSAGSFEGQLLNQFSADATGEYLRVATTRWAETGTVNAVQVLRTQGDTITLAGLVDNIAPGERIMSARFIDDRVYMVTFEQVDPLFTIDLSNPAAPKILGELKIPGFSRYLQPYGNGYLIGIGRDADPATGRTLGLKLSLFDVRDDAAPKELSTWLVATPENGWSWSSAEWDHHALGFFPELGLLAVPVESNGPWDIQPNGGYGAERKIDLMLFRVSVDNGISLLGTVSHDSPLLRSARIGDVIFSVADLDLKAVEVMADALENRGTVELQQPHDDGGSGDIVVAL